MKSHKHYNILRSEKEMKRSSQIKLIERKTENIILQKQDSDSDSSMKLYIKHI